MAAAPASASLAASGHSTKRDPLGREVVVQQGGVLARQRARAGRGPGGPPPAARASTWPIVKVGLVTGSFTPSARQAPRTKVVLPAAQLAAHQHHVAGRRPRGQLGAGGLGLLARAQDLTLHASAQRTVSRTGRAGPPAGLGLLGATAGGGRPAPARGSRQQRGQAGEVLPQLLLAPAACAARRPGGRSGRAAPAGPRARAPAGCPWTGVMPRLDRVSSLVAKLPSVQITFGSISSTWRCR